MAKNQNLTLNYSKLNGVCGHLKCCLQYEDEVYSHKRRKLPREGEFVKTRSGDSGKVYRLNILSEQFDVLTNKGAIKRFVANQLVKTISPQEARMPHKFDHISDETSNVIGLAEYTVAKEKYYQKEMLKYARSIQKYFKTLKADLNKVGRKQRLYRS